MTGLFASVTLALAPEVVDVLDPMVVVTSSLRVGLACIFRFSSIKVFSIPDFIS
jgi:hypothetical protein